MVSGTILSPDLSHEFGLNIEISGIFRLRVNVLNFELNVESLTSVMSNNNNK